MKIKKSDFLVAGRVVPEWQAAFSIASSWVWAPALFVSSQKAYSDGFAGAFWFIFPNVLTLILFAHFAEVLRGKLPFGYTLTAHIKAIYGVRVHRLYLLQSFGLLLSCLTVQLVGGAQALSAMTSQPFFWITGVLAALSMSYSVAFGLRASIFTDLIKMSFLLAALAILIPWAISNAGGVRIIVAGWGGKTGEGGSLFSAYGINVFWNFGLATTIGLLSGPFGDQAFYQRAFATLGTKVRVAFYKAAFLFALVPLALSVLGFLMAGSSKPVANSAVVSLVAVETFLPAGALMIFAIILASALLSAMDTHFTAVGSLAGHDLLPLANDPTDETTSVEDRKCLFFSRTAMVVAGLLAVLLANIPGIQILHLFLFYGTLRASTLLPTLLTILSSKPLPEAGVFWGIVASLTIGLPIFCAGNLYKITHLIVLGSLTTLLAPGLIALTAQKWKSA